MPRSEAAKELAAKQKAEVRAEKERRRQSTDPRDWGQVRQLRYAYTETAAQVPHLTLKMVGLVLAPVVVMLLVGLISSTLDTLWWFYLSVGLLLGLIVATFVFGRLQRRAAYSKYDGQAGSGELALRELDSKKWTVTPVLTLNKQQDVIHRAVGPGGLVLIAEGDPNRMKAMLATEVKRHEQVAYGVKVTTIQMGNGEGQVPLSKLSATIKKLPTTLDPAKVNEVNKRLKGMDAMRSRIPVPKGPLSTKGSRSALRGR